MKRIPQGYQHGNWQGHLDAGLSPRQVQATLLLANGLTHKQAARQLGITPGTLSDHVSTTLYKLKAARSPQAIGEAIRRGIITPLVLILGLLVNDSAVTHDTELRNNGRTSVRVARRGTRAQAGNTTSF